MYSKDWLGLNFQQTYNAQNLTNSKIGKNILVNRLKVMNGKTKQDWLNLIWNSYLKKHVKNFPLICYNLNE